MRLHSYWLVCVLAVATIASVPAGTQTCEPWTRIGAEPPFGGASLNGVKWGDGTIVAVGDGATILSTSCGGYATGRAPSRRLLFRRLRRRIAENPQFRYSAVMRATTQLGSRGQVTLPAEVRKAMGLKPGDTLVVSLEEGRLVLEPAVVLPIELYTEDRVEEFARAAEMSADELAEARRRWGV